MLPRNNGWTLVATSCKMAKLKQTTLVKWYFEGFFYLKTLTLNVRKGTWVEQIFFYQGVWGVSVFLMAKVLRKNEFVEKEALNQSESHTNKALRE